MLTSASAWSVMRLWGGADMAPHLNRQEQGGSRGQGMGRMQGRQRGFQTGAGCTPHARSMHPSNRSAIVASSSGAMQADLPVSASTATGPKPTAVAAVMRPTQCTFCETCLDVCRRSAITLSDTPRVDARLCTGCGACVNTCPNAVLALVEAF